MVLARSLKAGQIQRGVSQRGRRAFMPLHLGIGLIVPAPAPAFLVQRLAVDGACHAGHDRFCFLTSRDAARVIGLIVEVSQFGHCFRRIGERRFSLRRFRLREAGSEQGQNGQGGVQDIHGSSSEIIRLT